MEPHNWLRESTVYLKAFQSRRLPIFNARRKWQFVPQPSADEASVVLARHKVTISLVMRIVERKVANFSKVIFPFLNLGFAVQGGDACVAQFTFSEVHEEMLIRGYELSYAVWLVCLVRMMEP